MLIDLNDESNEILRKGGYNVTIGTFGKPYKVPKTDEWTPVFVSAELPNFEEQEIVILDVGMPELAGSPVGEKATTPKQTDVWASCHNGFVDPRPRAMLDVLDKSEQILRNGGLFVVFADQKVQQNQFLAKISEYDTLAREKEFNVDNWYFLLPFISKLEVDAADGEEMQVAIEEPPLSSLLSLHLKKGRYRCTLRWKGIRARWVTLVTNKYGEDVGGMILPVDDEKGCVLIFPKLANRPAFLNALLSTVLPQVFPDLFPYVEGPRWVERPEYELPPVLESKARIEIIKSEAAEQIAELERQIGRLRETDGYLHELIQETDRKLVVAVAKTLKLLGFNHVIDVDEKLLKESAKGKDEDLQIADHSPIILVEIKGIRGLPNDEESLQVGKHLVRRMKELKRTDIQGLTIINHQRHIAPLDRDNGSVFSKKQIDTADGQHIGLMTSWELFRIARGFVRNRWTHEQALSIISQMGRIYTVPSHYSLLGAIEDFWEKPKAVGINLASCGLHLGHRIAYMLPVEFVEQVVESIQIDGKPVDFADKGQFIGVKTILTKEQAKKGVKVFRVAS